MVPARRRQCVTLAIDVHGEYADEDNDDDDDNKGEAEDNDDNEDQDQRVYTVQCLNI